MRLAEVFFVHQIAMPDDHNAAVLAGHLGVTESLIETVAIEARRIANLRRRFQRSPAAL